MNEYLVYELISQLPSLLKFNVLQVNSVNSYLKSQKFKNNVIKNK